MFLAEDGRPIGLTWNYTRRELVADAVIHVVGIAFGVAGAIAIVMLAAMAPLDWTDRAAVVVYAAALASMLGVSATYNMWPVGRRKWILRRADHALIYLMIAGTYTPLVALVGRGSTAWLLLGLIWILSGVGIALKLLMPGRFDRAAIGLYLLLGWSGVATYESVIGALKPEALWLLAIGGALYSLGVIFHVWRSLPYQNAIWHAFVLAATACHYGTVLTSVIDAGR